VRSSLPARIDAASLAGRLPRPAGVSCARKFAFGAKMPWKRVRWARGGGTSAASLAMKSIGSNSRCVVPFFHGALSS
jgi:monoamine oxidase